MTAGVFSQFERLGDSIEHAWREHEFDTGKFSAIAVDALSELGPMPKLDLQFVLSGALSLRRMAAVEHVFSDLPIRVFQSQDFYIELLVWVDGTTSIHEHGFSGAFRLLSGASIHTRFGFQATNRLSRRFSIGDVTLLDSELLRTDQVREILPGTELMHSLFHLERPSVTVVVRTNGEPWNQPQANIYRPHLAVDYRLLEDPRVAFAGRAVRSLLQCGEESAVSFFAEAVAGFDLPRAGALCMTLAECPLLSRSDVRETIGRRFGPDGDKVLESLAVKRQGGQYVKMRRQVTDEKDRLVLALLATVPSRERMETLARAELGITDLYRRMAKLLLEGVRKRQTNLDCDDEDVRDVLELILDRRDRDECLASLGGSIGTGRADRQRPILNRLYDELERNVLLRGLLSPPSVQARL